MTRNKKISRKPFVFVLFLVAFVLSSFLPLFFNAPAHANSNLSPDQKARVYTAYRLLRSCISQEYSATREARIVARNFVTTTELAQGRVFTRITQSYLGFTLGVGELNTDHRIGYLFYFDAQVSVEESEGRVECTNSSVGDVLKATGLIEDVSQFFIDAEIYEATGDGTGFNLTIETKDEFREKILAEFEKRFSGSGIPFRGNMTPEMSYPHLRETFRVKCSEGLATGGVNVRVIENDGTVNTGNYAIRNTDGRHSVGYGQDRHQDTGGREGGSLMDCDRIIELMNEYADSYQSAINAFIQAGGEIPVFGRSISSRPSCESEGGSFVWLLCPFLERMDGIISYLDNQVNSLLLTPSDYYEDQSISLIWSRFRDIAYILLVPVMLMMVIGTALGFQFLDAYTVKRSLPRMFVAIIFIALSLPLLQLFIGTVNVLGQGVYGFISSVATGGQEPSLAGMFNPTPGQQAGFTAGVIAGALTLPIWYSFAGFLALSVFLTIATIFLLLAFRQLLIVSLIVVAPLAILSWIFPGNDKLWKLWWGSYWKLLLLYPLIMALLAIGRVFTFIVAGVGPGGLVEVVLKLVAYIGPFFLIPTAFKYAGGVFANIAGMTKDREKGIFGGLRKARGQSLSNRFKNTDAGKLFKGGNDSNLRGKYNRAMQGVAMAGTGKGGLNPLKMRRELRRSTSSAAREEQQKLMQESDAIKTAMVDDHIAKAVLSGGSEQEMRSYLEGTGRFNNPRELDEAVATARRAQQAGSATAVKAAMAVGLASSKTGYDSHSEMYESVIAAAGGDSVLERSLLADVKKASEGVRPDLAAPGYTDSWNALQQVKDGMGMNNTSRARVNGQVNAAQRRDALRKTGAHAMLAGKPTQTVEREMIELGNAFDAAKASGNVEEATEIASEIASYRNAMGSASPDARSHVMMMLDHVGVDTSLVNPATGMAVSTDEQLGMIVGSQAADWASVTDAQARRDIQRQATQEIRTRAGLYDAGGGDRTPAELRGMRNPDEIT